MDYSIKLFGIMRSFLYSDSTKSTYGILFRVFTDYLYNDIFSNINIAKNYHVIFYFGIIIYITKYNLFLNKNTCKKNNYENSSKSDSYIINIKKYRNKKHYSDSDIYFIKNKNDLSNTDDDYGQFVYI